MTADIDSFKAGMRRLAASVAILTVDAEGQGQGMTATAVCSVSAEPPALLCCINRASATREAFMQADAFAVNLLAARDRTLADRFARPMPADERFALGRWTRAVTGAPILESAIASFDCRRSETAEIGSHTIFFGEVEAVRLSEHHIAPLVYADGCYGKFAATREVPHSEIFWMSGWQEEG
ncbi:flavin reductase family protein [Parasphingopyxis marina]|uniref:Flavin reductase family protein n=1 Tax=Parasphingopyxis marina TaxID=2761622 RepID=A0A842I0A6_9SPHN|nr:flavin reductase family protein [Parasphingopyxis marina]MBC2778906.1 flavin reductase family protein [Parasphingopyxis marina]